MESPTHEQLQAFETRLSRIEKSLGISSAPSVNKSATTVTPTTSATVPPRSSLPPISRAETKPGNWLGIIGIICFIFAAGFIIKLSIDSGWLTPPRQIGLAVLFGVSLIFGGIKFQKNDLAYLSLLPAAGIIILYLSAFASHRFYSLVSFEVALALTSTVSVICIWLYVQIKHDLYALSAAVGAYCSPLILDLNVENTFTIYYFIICSMAFATISIWLRSRTLTILAAYLAIIITGIIDEGLHNDSVVAISLAIHFFIFAVGTYLYSDLSKTPLSAKEASSFLPVLLIFYAVEYFFIEKMVPDLAPWISLSFAGFLLGLYYSAKSLFPNSSLASLPLLVNFTTIVVFHSAYLEILPEDIRPWLFIAIVLGYSFAPEKYMGEVKNKFSLPRYAILLILLIEYISMLSHVIADNSLSWLVVSLASASTLWIILAKGPSRIRNVSHNDQALLGGTHLLAIVSLYRLGDPYGSLAVSSLWLLYGVFVIVLSCWKKDETMAKSALLALGFAAAKALLYDAASAPTLVRIVCLLLTGAVLYGAGFFLRRISHWNQPH